MGLLNKLKMGGGISSLVIGGYMLYSPNFSSNVVDKIYSYMDFMPNGPSPIGVDYKTIFEVGLAITTVISGITMLYDL